MVFDGLTNVLCSLSDFIGNLFAGGSESPKPNRYDHLAQLAAFERAELAIENLRAGMERGDTLRSEDLRNLTPEHLASLAAHGDDAMRYLVQREVEDRSHDYGRERCNAA